MKIAFKENTEVMTLAKADGKKCLFLIRTLPSPLGTLAAEVRFMAAYPVMPASEIMNII